MSVGGAFEEEYEEAAPPKKELFYTEGSALLKQARLHIAHFSLDRAAARLAGAKRKRESPDEDETAEKADTIRLMRKVLFIPLWLLRLCLLPCSGRYICTHTKVQVTWLSAKTESAKNSASSSVVAVVHHPRMRQMECTGQMPDE